MLGMATQLVSPKPEKPAVEQSTRWKTGDSAVLVRKTLRSGTHLEHDGHVTVIGDVNPGAEVSATGKCCRLGPVARFCTCRQPW